MTPLDFDTLDRVARSVSKRTTPFFQEDVYQATWVSFLRWPPRKRSYAYAAADGARNSLWRREQTQRKHRDGGSFAPPSVGEPDGAARIDAILELGRLEAAKPEVYRRLVSLLSIPKPNGNQRRMICYYRQKFRRMRVA